MESVFDSIRWVHIVVGFTGLVAFWIPAWAKKGGQTHVRAGTVFKWSAYIVGGSAIFNATGRLTLGLLNGARLADNREEFAFLLFLAYLGLVTYTAAHHAVRSVQVKKDPSALRTPAHMALAVLSILGSACVILYALLLWSDVSVVLLALSPVGVQQGVQMLSHMNKPPSERMWWFYSHMGNMIGAGIAFHTAFLVFGSARFITLDLPGLWQVLPWVLPAAIGIPASYILETRYRRKFNEPRQPRTRRARSEVATSG